ncbi:hypothetical protein ABT116_18220, partial [Streptomyces sp. NPDC002130]
MSGGARPQRLARRRTVSRHATPSRRSEDGAVSILCPYDAGQLEKQALSDARATHPVVIDA